MNPPITYLPRSTQHTHKQAHYSQYYTIYTEEISAQWIQSIGNQKWPHHTVCTVRQRSAHPSSSYGRLNEEHSTFCFHSSKSHVNVEHTDTHCIKKSVLLHKEKFSSTITHHFLRVVGICLCVCICLRECAHQSGKSCKNAAARDSIGKVNNNMNLILVGVWYRLMLHVYRTVLIIRLHCNDLCLFTRRLLHTAIRIRVYWMSFHRIAGAELCARASRLLSAPPPLCERGAHMHLCAYVAAYILC